jgi:hypothetical protein
MSWYLIKPRDNFTFLPEKSPYKFLLFHDAVPRIAYGNASLSQCNLRTAFHTFPLLFSFRKKLVFLKICLCMQCFLFLHKLPKFYHFTILGRIMFRNASSALTYVNSNITQGPIDIGSLVKMRHRRTLFFFQKKRRRFQIKPCHFHSNHTRGKMAMLEQPHYNKCSYPISFTWISM